MEDLVPLSYTNLSGLNVLVTGGTGVIGTWLLKRLVELQINTTVLLWDDHKNPELEKTSTLTKTTNIHGTLTDINLLKSIIQEHDINLIYHLGAQAIVESAFNDPFTTFESNIRGTYNLLEACRSYDTNIQGIIVASSDKAYGTHKNLPYTENTGLNGLFPYEVSKSCTDLLARSYAITYDMPISIARCGNVYGGGDLNWNRIIPGTILELFNERAPIIRSDGTHLRDYIYVEDIIDAYITLSSATISGIAPGQAFNFGNNNP
ncbi:MAG: NAD-dependent epimerase/dehydratase family protein, partial [Dehalococcoidia bacterium]